MNEYQLREQGRVRAFDIVYIHIQGKYLKRIHFCFIQNGRKLKLATRGKLIVRMGE